MPIINTVRPPSNYRVGTPTSVGCNDECLEFSSVMHVTHAFRAVETLRSCTLTGRLVYDDSSLNKSRVHVVWVSPNRWKDGFRYGTIALTFDWTALVAGRSAYWVEVAEYKPHACRILLTDREHHNLKPYDPTTKEGPWWHDESTDKHYYNNRYCLEVMVEGDLPLSQISETRFVSHHGNYCSEYRDTQNRCNELALMDSEAGAQFVALASAVVNDAKSLKIATANIEAAWKWIRAELPAPSHGQVHSTEDEASAVALSSLWLYGSKRDVEFGQICGLFATKADARKALARVIEEVFGLPLGSLP